MSNDDLPSGEAPVCPRCGATASGETFCRACGLNLNKQGKLPTADAYAARVREQRWLESQDRERQAEERARATAEQERAESGPTELSPARDESGLGSGAPMEPTGITDRTPVDQAALRRRRRGLIALAVAGALVCAGGATALLAGSDDGESTRRSEPTPVETGVEDRADQDSGDAATGASGSDPSTVDSWPTSREAYTVIVASKKTRREAEQELEPARDARLDRGAPESGVDPFELGILQSGDFPTLQPGFWVAYIGVYDTEEEARSALDVADSAGYSDAFVQFVSSEDETSSSSDDGTEVECGMIEYEGQDLRLAGAGGDCETIRQWAETFIETGEPPDPPFEGVVANCAVSNLTCSTEDGQRFVIGEID